MRLLIDKAELMRHIENEMREWGEEYDALQILGDIEDFPTVDPVRHGRWIEQTVSSGRDSWMCSECGRRARGKLKNLPYCHCGAKMDGKWREEYETN